MTTIATVTVGDSITAAKLNEIITAVNSSSGKGATGGGGDQVFAETNQVVTTDYTLTAGFNALSAGPLSINAGATVTIPTGATWSIV